MYLKKISGPLLAVLIVLEINTADAQQFSIDTIKATCPYGPKRKYIFPHIKITGNNMVAFAINKDLAKDMLDIDIRKVKKSIFENVWAGQDYATIRDDISFEYLPPRNKIFSIAISAEGCGAYCETFTNYYNYDLLTGKRIALQELLSPEGMQYILDSLTDYKKHQIQNKIQEATDSLKKRTATYYQDMINLYRQCTEDTSLLTSEFVTFMLSDTAFIFITERCSAHVNRNVDELGEFKISINFKNPALLSAYGRKLLLIKKPAGS